MKRLALILILLSSPTARAADVISAGIMRRDAAPAKEDLENLYFSLADLATLDQRHQMWAFSSNTKAALWKYNIERYVRNHPELTADAQEVLRDGIRLVSTPAWFDITKGSFGYEAKLLALEELKRRVKNALPPEAIFEVFMRLGSEPVSASVQRSTSEEGRMQMHENFSAECHCGDVYDCGSDPRYKDCFASYCIPVFHCGYYSDELCWGRCKYT